VDNEAWGGWIGKVVVVDTSSTYVYLGTLAEVKDHFVRLTEVDAGEERAAVWSTIDPRGGGVPQAAARMARHWPCGNLEHARQPRRRQHPLRLRPGQ